MSINGALHVGRSALLTSQAAMQVAGDNMANAATPGFHRRTVHMSPLQGQHIGFGQSIGQGVQITAIRREVDLALQSRFRDATSRESARLIDQRFLTAMETIQNELTDNDLSSMLSTFFNGFSELANNPSDHAIRAVVIQQGQSLADRLGTMREDYTRVAKEIDQTLDMAVASANDLLTRIKQTNAEITAAEITGAEAASLRDQRDMLLDELAQYIDITVIEQPGSVGSVDVFVGSTPLLLAGNLRGIEVRSEDVDGQRQLTVRLASDGTNLKPTGGMIGGLLTQRESTVNPMLDTIDTFAGELIFQVNRLHSQGQSGKGFPSVMGSYKLDSPAVAFNSSDSGLPFSIDNGSFFIHVTHEESGVRTAHEINVNGSMSMNDLISHINDVVGVPNVTASLGPYNQLQLTAASGHTMSFSDDTSGALAALGVNTFFTGGNASDIGVNQVLVDDPGLLSTGHGHVNGSNDTALQIAKLSEVSLSGLGGKTLRGYWQDSVSTLGVKLGAANAAVDSTRLVRESLDAQIQSNSGVSLDEESINLLMFQRQFQAAARYISVIDETLQTLLNL